MRYAMSGMRGVNALVKVSLFVLLGWLGTFKALAQKSISASRNDIVKIDVATPRGSLQWQWSLDGSVWNLMSGQNSNVLLWEVDELPVLLRLESLEGTCEPVYSEVLKIEPKLTKPSLGATLTTTNITAFSALLGGSVSDDGYSNILEKGIVFGKSPAPSLADDQIALYSLDNDPFTVLLTDLVPGTTYYARAFATNGVGTSYSNEVFFTTLTVAPLVTTSDVLSFGSAAAELEGMIISDGGTAIVEQGIVIDTNILPDLDDRKVMSEQNSDGTFRVLLNGLAPGVTYYYRSYAINEVGVSFGEQKEFTTSKTIPSVVTLEVDQIGATVARCRGMVGSEGGGTVTVRGIALGSSSLPTREGNHKESASGAFEFFFDDLLPSTSYYVRAYAVNEMGISYGNEVEFTTDVLSGSFGTATTDLVSNITATSASFTGAVSSEAGLSVLARGFVYGSTPSPTLQNTVINLGTTAGSFQANVQGLQPGVHYYLRAFVTNALGTAYGNQVEFTTLTTLPSVSVATATSITSTGVTLSSSVIGSGGLPVTAHGFAYGSSPSPTLQNSVVNLGATVGSFQTTLFGLQPGVQYYARAFATNALGTAYGGQTEFTTLTTIPSVAATTSASVTSTSATISSSVIGTGGLPVTARGFVWGPNANPTLQTAVGTSVVGAGNGAFELNINGLTMATEYFVRSYAVNSQGVAYGAQVAFSTLSPVTPTVLMFLSHEFTYYTEYVVMRKALEAAGYAVELRSSNTQPAGLYLFGYSNLPEVANNMNASSSYDQFRTQFENLFGLPWDEGLNNFPTTVTVAGRIQDVLNMNGYEALVIAGGTGSLDYRIDGSYSSQGTGDRMVSGENIQSAAEQLNALAVNALIQGKPVLAQCHAASLPVFWRIPGTSGPGVEAEGVSLLKGQQAAGYPEPGTATTLEPFGVTLRAEDRVTIASPNSLLNDSGNGAFKIITTRDWFPQTVSYAARTLLNVLETYPSTVQQATNVSVLVLHGGPVLVSDCSASNKSSNDVPCNYGNSESQLPADYTDLVALLGDSPNDGFNFEVTPFNIGTSSIGGTQQEILDYLHNYDVVIFFKHWSTGINTALQNAIVSFADEGGGVLALHHGLYNDDLGKNILVGLFGAQSAPWASLAEANRTSYSLFNTNYGHFVTTHGLSLPNTNSLAAPASWTTNALPLKANTGHTTFQNFSIFDELYNNMSFEPGTIFGRGINEICPMLSNSGEGAPQQCHVSGFIKLFNQTGTDVGRLAYFQPGERSENFTPSSRYGQIVRNAVFWLAQQ